KRMLWLTRNEGLVLNSLLPDIASWKSMKEPSENIRLEDNVLVFKFIRRPINLFEAISQPIYGIANPKCFDDRGLWKDAMCTSCSGQYRIESLSESSITLRARNVFRALANSPQLVSI